MDCKNLVYNGDFASTKCWSGSNLSVSNNILTVKGNLTHSEFIPVNSNDTYKISFDIKFNTTVSTKFYIALIPQDSDKVRIIIGSTNKVASTETTLAKAIANGNTTITLTDASKWDSSNVNQLVGICNNLAWGYNRNTYYTPYASRSGNVIELKSAWAGGSFPAGTKVANFRYGNTYFYPVYFDLNSDSTKWKSYSATFKGGNSIRYACQYFIFSTLGYENNYSMRNLKIENITSCQFCSSPYISPQISKTGNITTLCNELGRRIRYIKDSINGSNMNIYNHWVEIQAYNSVNANLAFNKDIWTCTNSAKVKTLVTDGSTNSSPYFEISTGSQYIVLDLGFVEQINSIKIWHYWSDGRTYNDHVISVSTDAVNWEIVYSGMHPETSNGFEIKLNRNKLDIPNTGIIDCSELMEI